MVSRISLVAVLSVSIGLLNLFPIPLLDGGHLLFFAIEAIRGRPLSDQAQEYGFRLGRYDRSRPLVLDPVVLVYCGYIGGSSHERGHAILQERARRFVDQLAVMVAQVAKHQRCAGLPRNGP